MTILTPESTALSWFSYDAATQRLTVGFRSLVSYQYSGVPEHVFASLATAPSRGRYFNFAIRSWYASRAVQYREPPEPEGLASAGLLS